MAMIKTIGGGLVNSDHVAVVEEDGDTRRTLISSAGKVIGKTYASTERIEAVCARYIPARADQEVVIVHLADERESDLTLADILVLRHPIIAWRIDLDESRPFPIFTDPMCNVLDCYIERSDGCLVLAGGDEMYLNIEAARASALAELNR
jgi:hypothetical protein